MNVLANQTTRYAETETTGSEGLNMLSVQTIPRDSPKIEPTKSRKEK